MSALARQSRISPAFQTSASNPIPAHKRYPAPLTLRLSESERERLERDAGDLTLSAYVRLRLFGDDVPAHRTRGKRPVKDCKALGQLTGVLGRSNIGNNLNQLTKAVHTGTLGLSDDTEAVLRRAAYDIACMRHMLVKALGLKD